MRRPPRSCGALRVGGNDRLRSASQENGRTLPWSGLELQRGGDERRALTHAGHTDAVVGQPLRVEAYAVVLDHEDNLTVARGEHDIDAARVCVLRDVVERFLSDSIERDLGVAGKLAGFEAAESELRRNADVCRPLADEPRQRRREPELVERARAKLPREEIEVAADLIRQRQRPRQLLAGVGAFHLLLHAFRAYAQRRE